jgi:hypothetical protein
MLRDATLVAAMRLDPQRVRPSILIGAGMLATGVALALVHVAGVDLRAWVSPGQTGLGPGLLETFYAHNTQPEST